MIKLALGISTIAIIISGCNGAQNIDNSLESRVIEEKETAGLISHLSANSFITRDAEASAAFYSKYLGYVVERRTSFPASASGPIYGYFGDEMLDYLVMVPPRWSLEKDEYPGLSFMQLPEIDALPYSDDTKRAGLAGEIVMTFDVEDIQKVHDLLKRDGVQFVSPLTTSMSGKSKTLTVLDPNGVRVYIYGYINPQ